MDDCVVDFAINHILQSSDMIIRYYLGVWSDDEMPDEDADVDVAFVTHQTATHTTFLSLGEIGTLRHVTSWSIKLLSPPYLQTLE